LHDKLSSLSFLILSLLLHRVHGTLTIFCVSFLLLQVEELKGKQLIDNQVVGLACFDGVSHFATFADEEGEEKTNTVSLLGNDKTNVKLPFLVSQQNSFLTIPRAVLKQHFFLRNDSNNNQVDCLKRSLRVNVEVFVKINQKYYQVFHALRSSSDSTSKNMDQSTAFKDFLTESEEGYYLDGQVLLTSAAGERLKCLLTVSAQSEDASGRGVTACFSTPDFVALPQGQSPLSSWHDMGCDSGESLQANHLSRKRKQNDSLLPETQVCSPNGKPCFVELQNNKPTHENEVLEQPNNNNKNKSNTKRHRLNETIPVPISSPGLNLKPQQLQPDPRRRSDDSDPSTSESDDYCPESKWGSHDASDEEDNESETLPHLKRKEERDQLWLSKLQQLKEWQQEFGTFKVKGKKNTQLAAWTRRQRYLWRNGKLSKERERLLNSIGFVWINDKEPTLPVDDKKENPCPSDTHKNKEKDRARDREKDRSSWEKQDMPLKKQSPSHKYRQEAWQRKFEEFRAEWLSVGEGLRSNPQLTSWVRQQRYLWRNGRLSQERERMLNEIGFEWHSDGRIKKKDRRDDVPSVLSTALVTSAMGPSTSKAEDSDEAESEESEDSCPHTARGTAARGEDDEGIYDEVESLQEQLQSTHHVQDNDGSPSSPWSSPRSASPSLLCGGTASSPSAFRDVGEGPAPPDEKPNNDPTDNMEAEGRPCCVDRLSEGHDGQSHSLSEWEKLRRKKAKFQKEKAVVLEVKGKVQDLLSKIHHLQNQLYREQQEEREKMSLQQDAWEKRKLRLQDECKQLEHRKQVLEAEISRRQRWNRLAFASDSSVILTEPPPRIASLSSALIDLAERLDHSPIGDEDMAISGPDRSSMDGSDKALPLDNYHNNNMCSKRLNKREAAGFGTYAQSVLFCLDEVLRMQHQLAQQLASNTNQNHK